MLQAETQTLSIQPEVIFSFGNLGITNAMLMGVFVTVLLALISTKIAKVVALKPGRLQSNAEFVVESFVSFMSQLAGSEENARKLLPLIGTLFVFFGISNIIGLLPGLTSITYDGVSIFRTPTNDFNMTFSVAFAMVAFTHVASMAKFGFFGHLGKFFKFKGILTGFKTSFGEGFIAIIDFLIGLLDIISEFAKVISLSLRLFGNMFAGEVLAGVLLGVFALVLPAPWTAANLVVGLLQAMVFGSLTTVYYALAVE